MKKLTKEEYKEQKLEERQRQWCLVTYNPPESFLKYCEKDNITGGFYIYHDKDNNEPHYHVYLESPNGIRLRTIQKAFGTQNTTGEKLKRAKAYKLYILHKTDKDQKDGKHEYNEEEIHYFGQEVLQEEIQQSKTMQIIDDILSGISLRELIRKHGAMIVWHWTQYRDCAELIAKQEAGLCLSYQTFREDAKEQWRKKVRQMFYDEYAKAFEERNCKNGKIDRDKVKEGTERKRKSGQTEINTGYIGHDFEKQKDWLEQRLGKKITFGTEE